MEKDNAFLSMRGITKVYSNGMVANSQVDFSVHRGEIHALMGENGAGKSTLMKVLFGIERPDGGSISLEGREVSIPSTSHAIALGIGMVHQHFKLVEPLTVAENIVLGVEPRRGPLLDQAKALADVEALCQRFGFPLQPDMPVEELSVGKKQKVEILKAIYRGAKLLILDEPTAVLTPQETAELFGQLEQLRQSGITIIFISHKLTEIKQICQRLTIMRAGRGMGTYDVQELSAADISRLMVGRDVVLSVQKQPAKPGNACLKVQGLSWVNSAGKKSLDGVSFTLRTGEILGVAGVEGSGQRELVELVCGMRPPQPGSGTAELCGAPALGLPIRRRRESGLAYIPEDRLSCGVAEAMTIRENLISSVYAAPGINGRVFSDGAAIQRRVAGNVQDYDIRCASPRQTVQMLSGGNMQKVVIAREFSTNPKVLIADQPTRGVDVGAIEFIHKKIVEIRDKGCGVLLVSADLNEVLELSDSVLVLCQGRIAAYFPDVRQVSEEALGYYMLGLKRQPQELLEVVCHEG